MKIPQTQGICNRKNNQPKKVTKICSSGDPIPPSIHLICSYCSVSFKIQIKKEMHAPLLMPTKYPRDTG